MLRENMLTNKVFLLGKIIDEPKNENYLVGEEKVAITSAKIEVEVKSNRDEEDIRTTIFDLEVPSDVAKKHHKIFHKGAM